jgi:hypothetical protein
MLWAGFVPNEADWNLSLVRKVSGYYLPCPFDQVSWDQSLIERLGPALKQKLLVNGDAGFGTSKALRLCSCAVAAAATASQHYC